jgi:hypothetical protein
MVVLTAVDSISVHNGVRRLDASVGEVRRNVDFHSGLLGIELVFWITSRDQGASIVEQDGFTVAYAGNRCGVEDGELWWRCLDESSRSA